MSRRWPRPRPLSRRSWPYGYDTNNKGETAEWRDFIAKNRAALTTKGHVIVAADKNDNNLLLIYDLGGIVTLEALRSPETFRERTTHALRLFTETSLPVLKKKRR